MVIAAKPENYHIGVFINEDEEYLFKTSEASNSKVDIAGEYWPEFQVCKNWKDLANFSKAFLEAGRPPNLFNWIYFSEEN